MPIPAAPEEKKPEEREPADAEAFIGLLKQLGIADAYVAPRVPAR